MPCLIFPSPKGDLRVQGSSGGSLGARKKPSWQGQVAAAAGEGRVWSGQGRQPLGDTAALKEPGGQAGTHTHTHTMTSVRPQIPTHSTLTQAGLGGGGGITPPSTQSGDFRVFPLILQLL